MLIYLPNLTKAYGLATVPTSVPYLDWNSACNSSKKLKANFFG